MLLTKLPAPVLVLGAAHAGKSALAMQMLAPDRSAVVIGTGVIQDARFRERIDDLKMLRPAAWTTLENNRDLPGVLAGLLTQHNKGEQILVDSLNQWLAAEVIEAATAEAQDNEPLVTKTHAHIQRLINELEQLIVTSHAQRLVCVSSEAGAGPAPARLAEREYRRALGIMNQRLARLCKSVVLVTAGIPQILKTC